MIPIAWNHANESSDKSSPGNFSISFLWRLAQRQLQQMLRLYLLKATMAHPSLLKSLEYVRNVRIHWDENDVSLSSCFHFGKLTTATVVGPCLFSSPVQSVSLINRGRHGKRRKAAYSATQQLGHPVRDVRVQKLLKMAWAAWNLMDLRESVLKLKAELLEPQIWRHLRWRHRQTCWKTCLTRCLTLFKLCLTALTRGWVVITPLNVWLNWPVKLCCEFTAWSLARDVGLWSQIFLVSVTVDHYIDTHFLPSLYLSLASRHSMYSIKETVCCMQGLIFWSATRHAHRATKSIEESCAKLEWQRSACQGSGWCRLYSQRIQRRCKILKFRFNLNFAYFGLVKVFFRWFQTWRIGQAAARSREGKKGTEGGITFTRGFLSRSGRHIRIAECCRSSLKNTFSSLFSITSRATDQCIRPLFILVERLSYVPTRQSLPARSDQITPPLVQIGDWVATSDVPRNEVSLQNTDQHDFSLKTCMAAWFYQWRDMARMPSEPRIPSEPRMGHMDLSSKSILAWQWQYISHVLANLPSGHATPQLSGCGLPRCVWWGTTEPGTPWGGGLIRCPRQT